MKVWSLYVIATGQVLVYREARHAIQSCESKWGTNNCEVIVQTSKTGFRIYLKDFDSDLKLTARITEQVIHDEIVQPD